MSNIKSNVEVFNTIWLRMTIDNFLKYIIQGIAVAIAACIIPNRKTSIREIVVIAIVSTLTFFILDVFTDDIGKNARLGVGLGIGLNLANLM